jgi:hypothetical protein
MEDEEVRLTALDKPARRGRSPALFFTQEELKMCMDDYEFFNQKKDKITKKGYKKL